jgi:hypothetical protein
MRILIDECLNWRLARALTGHFAVSAQKMGWGGIKNGALLENAAQEFDVFITDTLQTPSGFFALSFVQLGTLLLNGQRRFVRWRLAEALISVVG